MTSYVIDPEELIIQIKCRRLLYDRSLPDYSNRHLKNDAWEEITEKLSDDWELLTRNEKINRCKEIQYKWKHIRDNFRREHQSQKDVPSGQGAKKRKKYRYYEKLQFLVPHTKDVKILSNDTPSNESKQNTENRLPTSNEENESDAPFIITSNVKQTQFKKKRKVTPFEQEILKALRKDTAEPDEDKTFCLSLVQSLKKMDDDTKISAKIEILKIIRSFSNKLQTA